MLNAVCLAITHLGALVTCIISHQRITTLFVQQIIYRHYPTGSGNQSHMEKRVNGTTENWKVVLANTLSGASFIPCNAGGVSLTLITNNIDMSV